MYKSIRPFLFRFDAETSHNFVTGMVAWIAKFRPARLIRPFFNVKNQKLETDVFGLHFENPIGLAAGFDKNAKLIDFLPAIGFGFLEIGTVTAHAQPGNPRPRLFRLQKDEALINRMGFNLHDGPEKVCERVKARRSNIILGVNIGKSKITPIEQADDDYVKNFNLFSDYADYMVINVSSPNTPGLRQLQDREPLERLLTKIKALNVKRTKPKPLLVKITVDLNDDQLGDIAQIVKKIGIDGMIISNTTIRRDNLTTDADAVTAMGEGGVSGKPLRERSTEMIRKVYRLMGKEIPIIGVGGIFSAEDAYEKIKAGASLVQIYTALIYEGPGLVKKINQDLIQLLQRDGFPNIRNAVGIDA